GKQRCLFGHGIAGGEALEGVPERLVAAAALVDREVALEHAAFGPERLDAGLDIGTPRRGKLLRARGDRPGMHIKAEETHAKTAKLHMDIRTAAEFDDPAFPFGEDFVALAGIGADADRAADMVQHDLRLRKGPREIDQLAELSEIH